MPSHGTLGMPAIYYPVVRGTVIAVNERTDRPGEGAAKAGRQPGREFNLTYRDRLLDDERIVAGKGLFRKDWPGSQVSVLDTVLKMRDMKIGDTITFRIQGIPIEARISSIRTRTRAALQPFFYFVFPERGPQGRSPDPLHRRARRKGPALPRSRTALWPASRT